MAMTINFNTANNTAELTLHHTQNEKQEIHLKFWLLKLLKFMHSYAALLKSFSNAFCVSILLCLCSLNNHSHSLLHGFLSAETASPVACGKKTENCRDENVQVRDRVYITCFDVIRRLDLYRDAVF
jgi:hypothetical protein